MCEVCGRTETLSAAAAYDAGWDMPPRMGDFGTVSPRVCPRCPMLATAWFAMALRGCALEDLTDRQRAAVARMLAEPESLALTPEEAAQHTGPRGPWRLVRDGAPPVLVGEPVTAVVLRRIERRDED